MDVLIGENLHQLPADEVLQLLGTDAEKGLDILELQTRQARFGPNLIPAARGLGPWMRFLLQFHTPLVYILLAAAAITAFLHEWVDSGVIFAVVLVNAVIGFLQESSAAKALAALTQTTLTEASVLRAGEMRRISSTELVPGDIVFLQSGDKVPADLRLFHCRDLQVDESALTGESVPVNKQVDVMAANASLEERRNLAYTSTLVTYGQARGVVFATGASTEVGHISKLISTADVLETPLTLKIAKFSRLLLVVILGLACVTFLVGCLRGQPAFEMFMAAVALAVGAIPEGLPAAVTITLSIGVARMARRRAIIRKLPAVETLGSTTIVCSDKTGTLTVNQMTVSEILAGDSRYEVSGTGYGPLGEIKNLSEPGVALADNFAARECLLAGLLCNDSALAEKAGRWEVQGDPTEGALIASAAKGGLNQKESSAHFPRIDVIPFESQHQYMASLHEGKSPVGRKLYVKGAAEVVLSKSVAMLDASGRKVPLDSAAVHRQLESLAVKGLRVLVLASAELPGDVTSVTHADVNQLTFLGLQGMIDPPRPEAISAVRACQSAGIHVKMITGDHALTAQAIARQIGLNGGGGTARPEGPLVLTGRELAERSDAQLIDIAAQVAVFARVTPEQKLRLVRALQAGGHIAAMTGDGVNDAPALKQADIGVAMGVSGTEVAKEAADMVLTDDNFATIEAAVEEGRGVFDNLTKFIVWTLPTNMGEGLVILAAIFAGTTLPILPVQILWINMSTGLFLGLMLAFEPKEPDIMTRPPRDPKTPILTGVLIGRILLVSLVILVGAFGSFEWALGKGSGDAHARTVAVNVIVMVELFYLFNCRSLTKSMFQLGVFSNLWIWVGVGSMVALQLLFTYAPFMNWFFHSAPIGWDAWWRILLTAVVAHLIVGMEKWIRRKWTDRASVGVIVFTENKARGLER
ncbi:putative cation-transporting ATPase F [Anatilimnocola aggregata]|uniref:Putative cation-transporting ATPase F n=1 Tax=Anatilimnocola aggregata TaxID=2528021 RepID=A0A517YGC6_9BACT|nr:cation-transporting P-type ATPase [Anatilimnocola aggregata]QDU29261.1 putative cation-transporting ATPase F [Anatilimnocola aggregata]